MSKKSYKILSLLLCFCLIFEQTGFAQIAGSIDISGYLRQLRQTFAPDKFRPLHLRYLQYLPGQNSFRLFIDKGDFQQPQDIEDTTRVLLKYFFVGLALSNDSFWVNLRPDSPDNIIDPFLARTDVGKILLEADLQLKKDTAKFTSPETPEGKEYWDKLYQRAGELFGSQNIIIPTLTRPWIVPDEIIIRETEDNAYIYKATLKVMLEEDYLDVTKSQGHQVTSIYNFSDPRLKELNGYSSQLIRETIIPKLTKEINTSRRYAPLRQVYYSLILASWFKARRPSSLRAAEGSEAISNLINSRNLTNLTSQQPWSQDTYFNAYKENFQKGEYNIKEPMYTPYGQAIRSYFSGGINILAVPTGRISGQGPIGIKQPYVAEIETSGTSFPPSLRTTRDHPEFGPDTSLGQIRRNDNASMATATADLRYHKPTDARLKEISRSAESEVQVNWEGERPAQGIFSREVFEYLKQTQPEILDRIEKIVTQYPDSLSWSDLHDGEYGFNQDKRTVRIKLKKELVIDGEVVDEIHIQGVLFTKEDYERQRIYQAERAKKADTIRGAEFDREGRLIQTPFEQFLLGATWSRIAQQKYDNSLRMKAEGIMRSPIALGYLFYNSLYMQANKKQLGVFIYAQRKNAPEERALKLVRMPGAPVEKYFEAYGRALRESYNLQSDPSLANVTLDIAGRQRPIYHDLGEMEFRRDLSPQQAFAYRYAVLASGFHRALEFMEQNKQQMIFVATGFNSQMACVWFLKGFFYDKLEDKRFKIGMARVTHSLEDADPNAELPNLIWRYMTLDSFGNIDLVEEEKNRRNPTEVIPMHWRSMVPFLPLLYEIEQSEYQYQPNYVNLAVAQAYENLRSGRSIEEQSLEVFHQLLLLSANEKLVNVDTTIDILKAAKISQYSKMIEFLEHHGKEKNLYDEIAENMPDLRVSPEDIREILKRTGRKLHPDELKALRPPALPLESFRKEEGQRSGQLSQYVSSLEAGVEVWEQRLSHQFQMSLTTVQQTLKSLGLTVSEVQGRPGAWKREASSPAAPSNIGLIYNAIPRVQVRSVTSKQGFSNREYVNPGVGFIEADGPVSLYTDSLGNCAAIVIIDKRRRKQYLAHVEPEEYKKMAERFSDLLHKDFLQSSEIYILEGNRPSEYPNTVHNILHLLEENNLLRQTKFIDKPGNWAWAVVVSRGNMSIYPDPFLNGGREEDESGPSGKTRTFTIPLSHTPPAAAPQDVPQPPPASADVQNENNRRTDPSLRARHNSLAGEAIPESLEIASSQKPLLAMTSETPRNDGARDLGGIDSSPSSPSILRQADLGGIDFTVLPAATQTVLNTGLLRPDRADASVGARNDGLIDIDEERREIERLLGAGILPSSERVKEYALAVLSRGGRDKNKVVSCVMDILRLEEERCCPTEPVFRDILIVLESLGGE